MPGTKGCLCIKPLEGGQESICVEYERVEQTVAITVTGSIGSVKSTEDFTVTADGSIQGSIGLQM